MYELVADPNEVGQVAPYTGFVSTIGTLIFCAIVSICLFSAYLTKQTNKKSKDWSLFFKCSGYFILLLLVDDLWQIHENFSTLLLAIGININLTDNSIQNFLETVVFAVYGLLFATYLLRFKKIIYQTELLTIVLACIFFGLSTVIDLFLEDISGHFILEEGFKLLGIVSLLIYYTRICYQRVQQFINLR